MSKAARIKALRLEAEDPSTKQPWKSFMLDSRVRFCVFFVVGLAGLMWIFNSCQSLFSELYLWPISWTAATLIDLAGVSVVLRQPLGQVDSCIIEIGRIIFHVEHQCSGISAFFIFLAALGAYPASLGHKVYGALLSMPAFFAYGALRLVVLGAIANSMPDLLRFFHLYFMVVLNLGFVMMLWITWIRKGKNSILLPA